MFVIFKFTTNQVKFINCLCYLIFMTVVNFPVSHIKIDTYAMYVMDRPVVVCPNSGEDVYSCLFFHKYAASRDEVVSCAKSLVQVVSDKLSGDVSSIGGPTDLEDVISQLDNSQYCDLLDTLNGIGDFVDEGFFVTNGLGRSEGSVSHLIIKSAYLPENIMNNIYGYEGLEVNREGVDDLIFSEELSNQGFGYKHSYRLQLQDLLRLSSLNKFKSMILIDEVTDSKPFAIYGENGGFDMKFAWRVVSESYKFLSSKGMSLHKVPNFSDERVEDFAYEYLDMVIDKIVRDKAIIEVGE